jgi:hypothetical protein
VYGYSRVPFLTTVGGSDINFSPAEKDVEVVKRTGRQMWRPERVVRAAGGVFGDSAARGDCWRW